MKSISTLLFLFVLLINQTLVAQINHDWSFKIGSKDSEGSGGSVVDHEGNIYILMEMKDTADMDPGPAIVQVIPEFATSLVLTKYDEFGNLIFAYPFYCDDDSYGAVMEARYNHIKVSINFNDSLVYEVNGHRNILYNHPGRTSALLTFDLDGNIIDSYFFAVPGGYYINNLYTFPDGRTVLEGAFNDTLIFNPQSTHTLISSGEDDAYIMMIDADYLPVWSRQFKGTGDDYFNSLSVWKDQRIYFTGGFEDTLRINTVVGPKELVSAGDEDPFYGYLSMTGDIVKIYTFGGPSYDEMRDLQVDANGNMYVCGSFEGTVNFAYPSQDPSLRTSIEDEDGYVAKYNEDGILEWLGIYPNEDYGGVQTIALERDDELYVTGIWTLKGDLDPGPDSIIVYTGYHSSPFISKLTTDGELLWSVPFYTNEVAGIRELTVLTEDSRIVVNGFFYDSLQCGTVAGENWLGTEYGADCFVASYSEENVVTANQEIIGQVSTDMFNVFPNPVVENCTITSKENLNSISIYNSAGNLVRQIQDIHSNQLDLDLNGFPTGLYYISGTSQDKVMTCKVIKQ